MGAPVDMGGMHIYKALPALLLVACVAESEVVDTASTDQAVTSDNGVSLNGVSLNGVSLNGVSLNGVSLNGVSLNGSQLQGTNTKTNKLVNGKNIAGAQFTGSLADGSTVKLKIADAATLAAPNADVWAYGVTYQLPGTTTWTPLCAGSAKALVIDGSWDYRTAVAGAGGWVADPSTFTFTCRGASMAKCVEMGYKPWKTVSNVLLRDHHTACVRMLRADYCGDNRPHTIDGNLINVYDAFGIQTDTQAWAVDAEWTAAGARCVDNTRHSLSVEPCIIERTLDSCGTFSDGALLIDEYQ
jgi:hypothetical protein